MRADDKNRVVLSAYTSSRPCFWAWVRLPNSISIYSPFTLDVLQKRPTTPTLKHYTIDHLRSVTGSFDYTLKVMTELEQQVCQLSPLFCALNLTNSVGSSRNFSARRKQPARSHFKRSASVSRCSGADNLREQFFLPHSIGLALRDKEQREDHLCSSRMNIAYIPK